MIYDMIWYDGEVIYVPQLKETHFSIGPSRCLRPLVLPTLQTPPTKRMISRALDRNRYAASDVVVRIRVMGTRLFKCITWHTDEESKWYAMLSLPSWWCCGAFKATCCVCRLLKFSWRRQQDKAKFIIHTYYFVLSRKSKNGENTTTTTTTIYHHRLSM